MRGFFPDMRGPFELFQRGGKRLPVAQQSGEPTVKKNSGGGVEAGQDQEHRDGRPGPQQNHDCRRERHTGEQTEGRHPKGQQKGVQETLAFLLHFDCEQFEPVFPDGQQPARKTFRGRSQLPQADGGVFHDRINRGCGSSGGARR